jgi:hypothetical protein
MPRPHVPVPNQDGNQLREARPIGTPIVELVAAVAFSIACVISPPTIFLSVVSKAAAQTNLEHTTKALPRLLLGGQARHDVNRQREGSEAVAIGLIGPTGLGDGPYYSYGDYYGRGDYFTVDTLSRCRD